MLSLLSFFFLIVGLYIIFKKEVKISSKRSITGPITQKIGLIFIMPMFLSFIAGLFSKSFFSAVLSYIALASYMGVIISIFYFTFFYKTSNKNIKTNTKDIIKKDAINNVLRSKWYYRLLIVIYIGLFLLISATIIYYIFDSVGNYQTDFEIKCYFGNKETFFAFQDKNIIINKYTGLPNYGSWHSNQFPNDWSVMTVATKGCGLSGLSAQTLFNTGSNIFDAKFKKVNIFTYSHAIFWSVLVITIITLIFEIIRRIFYFVVLGTLFPKKDK